jgi:exodeoxyribonuclease VII large subunit
MLGEFFSDVWIEGEVSNLKSYPSGHLYFVLKDEESQIQAVCFRPNAARLKFVLEDGLLVVGHGRLEVYAPAGKYQVIIDTIEPKGLGALQKAFEQLKRKLEKEGLFEEGRKRPLPALPRVLGVVTSPAGAAIHDMLRTLRLHRGHLKVLLFPAQVQGEGAAGQIADAILTLSSRPDVDVMIVGRGGGSTEDLWPFNEEVVARAIAASRVPVITGIGHEVDFTIADFVADVRAATPTAAAQLVARGWEELEDRIADQARALLESLEEMLLVREQTLDGILRHRAFDLVAGRLVEARYRLDRLRSAAESLVRHKLSRSVAGYNLLRQELTQLSPVARILRRGNQLEQMATRAEQMVLALLRQTSLTLRSAVARVDRPVQASLNSRATRLGAAAAGLEALSPLASLGRGYSICMKPDGAIVSRVGQTAAGEQVSVRVSDGSIPCRVENGRGAARTAECVERPGETGSLFDDTATKQGD